MPNIKSAIKRISVNSRRSEENRGKRTEVLTVVKKFNVLVSDKKYEEAEKEYSHVVSVLDGAVNKGILKKENADRKKSNLALALSKAKKA